MRNGRKWVVLPALLTLAACSSSPAPRSPLPSWPSAAGPVPTASSSTWPDHVVIVVFENKAFGKVDSATKAPYLTALMNHSAVYTDLHAETHPSQPNYIALFSGDPQGVTSDRCPVRFHQTPNLGRQLLDAGFTFTGYSEGLPRVGYGGCSSGRYAAKHNPWVDFDNLPAEVNQPASALPADYAKLPTVSFLVPDLCDDMHDCPVNSGDAWAQTDLDPYAQWAVRHNSVLIVTFDEDDQSDNNRILTLVCGAHATPGRYADPATHYSILATVESWYGLGRLGHAAAATPLPHAWDAG